MRGSMARLAACLLTMVAVAACSSSKTTTTPTKDAGTDTPAADTVLTDVVKPDVPVADVPPDIAPDLAVTDVPGDVSAVQGPVARGSYLVKFVMACGDCHTPRMPDGSPDMTKQLAGVPAMFDLAPTDPSVGAIGTPNLTPDKTTGLGNWTDDQIKTALTTGMDDKGKPLFPIMPYWLYHNLTADDATAIVAYLRTLPAVANAIPERQPLGFPFTVAAQPLGMDQMPLSSVKAGEPAFAQSQNGRYLVAVAGCVDCHTAPSAAGVPLPVDVTRILAGNRDFPASEFGLPTPPFPVHIFSANLTPHANGIAGWTTTQIQTALQKGLDKDGNKLCPPMPAGPKGPFAGMTDTDALAIGTYLLTIPPVDTGKIDPCKAP